MASAAARERYARKNEEDELERAFRTIDKKGDDKIDADELNQLFLALGHKAKRGEVEDMIWEVDEDCDGCLSWLEFQNLYTRGRDDKTGYEPRGLFNVVEFVMNDKEGQGFITLEEAMQIMYLRYGRQVVPHPHSTAVLCSCHRCTEAAQVRLQPMPASIAHLWRRAEGRRAHQPARAPSKYTAHVLSDIVVRSSALCRMRTAA